VCYLLHVFQPGFNLLAKKDNSETEIGISAIVAKPYRLQTNDVLSISIKAIDPKLVAILVLQTKEPGKSESLYFDGFTVDDHGNIRMPVLGELNVIGFTLDEIRVKIEKQLLAEYFKRKLIFCYCKISRLQYTINGEIGSTERRLYFRKTIMEAIANVETSP
jgi:polysaccharide export outer membrane protein